MIDATLNVNFILWILIFSTFYNGILSIIKGINKTKKDTHYDYSNAIAGVIAIIIAVIMIIV